MSKPRDKSALTLLAPMVAYFTLFILLPLCIVLYYSICTRGDDGGVLPLYTLRNYRDTLDPNYFTVLVRSVEYAAVTTLACLLLGYPLAYTIALYGGRRKNTMVLLVMLPFWTSYLIRIYSWRVILASKGVLNTVLLGCGLIAQPLQILSTPTAVLLGLIYSFLPFMTLPIYASCEKLNRKLLEAASDLGATPAATFFKVSLPLTMPGIVAGCMLTFIPVVGDFVTPDLLGGPQTQMIGTVIESKFFPEQDWPHGSALAFLLMGLLMLGMWAYSRFVAAQTDTPPEAKVVTPA